MKTRRTPGRELGSGEALADHLLALRPQSLGALGIERIRADTGEREPRGVDNVGDVTILAIASTDRVGLRDRRRPHRSRRARRDRFVLDRLRARQLADLRRDFCRLPPPLVVLVAAEFCLNSAGMKRGGADSTVLMAAIELDREQDVGRFRTAVRRPCAIGLTLEIRIVEIDVRKLMAG